MLRHSLALAIATVAVMFGCGENTIDIGNPPPKPQFSIDKTDPNRLVFKVESAEGFMVNWDFGNGTLSQKNIDTIYYPFADTYTVKLTVSNKGGATTNAQTLIIATTDPKICTNRYYEMLTGGCNATSKTWKFDSANGALANGPPSPKSADSKGTSTYNDVISYWWQSTLNGEKSEPPTRSLDDEYVFGLKGFPYANNCHGDFYFNWKWANKLFGLNQTTYADTICGYTPNNPATWKLDVDTLTPEETTAQDSTTWKRRFFVDSATGKRFNLILTLSNSNYIGYCSGVSIYQILRLNQDTMYLRHELAEPTDPNVTGQNRTEWRYLRLVAKK